MSGASLVSLDPVATVRLHCTQVLCIQGAVGALRYYFSAKVCCCANHGVYAFACRFSQSILSYLFFALTDKCLNFLFS